MYPPPKSHVLEQSQRVELDDRFFATDQWAYNRARIAMLIKWADDSARDNDLAAELLSVGNSIRHTTSSVRDQFANLIRHDLETPSHGLGDAVAKQAAIDAFNLRHHLAEALVRLVAARIRGGAHGSKSLWELLAAGPNQLEDEVKLLPSHESSDVDLEDFVRHFFPRDIDPLAHPDVRGAADVFVGWFDYAVRLLRAKELDLNGVHNKLKHGMAVHATDSLRVDAILTRPVDLQAIPVGTFRGDDSFPVFDHPVVEVMLRQSNVPRQSAGLELLQVHLSTATLLADAYMLAWTHASVMFSAGRAHFEGRLEEAPGWLRQEMPIPVGGPSAMDMRSNEVVGMRFPLTTARSSHDTRSAGIAFRGVFVPLHVTAHGTGRAVPDQEHLRGAGPSEEVARQSPEG